MLSIGGWNAGSANFSLVSSTVSNRETFAYNVAQFLREYDFDGLDVMWLYPSFREGGKPEDKENFGFLLEVNPTISLHLKTEILHLETVNKSKTWSDVTLLFVLLFRN
jgi:hypothetical protein